MTSMNTQTFAERIAANDLPPGSYELRFEDFSVTLPVALLARGDNATICYGFHGAIDQTKRALPVFYGAGLFQDLATPPTFISIADPSLRLSAETLFTWYAGDHAFPTQRAIRALVEAVQAAAKPSKTIFVGGSSGGHPTLLHSHAVPGSICLTVNPLASIKTYPTNLARYEALCWPSGSPLYEDDVFERYAAGYDNHVIVLQNAFDNHLQRQGWPLVHALSHHPGSLVLTEFFSDYVGHKYPAQPLQAWFRAALSVAQPDLEKIAHLANPAAKPAEPAPPAAKSSRSFPDAKIQLADRIAADLKGARA